MQHQRYSECGTFLKVHMFERLNLKGHLSFKRSGSNKTELQCKENDRTILL